MLLGKTNILLTCALIILTIRLHADDSSKFELPEPIISIKIYPSEKNQDIYEIAALSDWDFKDYKDITLELNQPYWLKITIDNQLVEDEYYVIHFESTLSYVSLFQQEDFGFFKGQKAGILIPKNARALEGFIKDKVPFKISHQPQTILYIRIFDTWGEAPDIADIAVIPEIKFNHWLSKNDRCQFFFLGIITILCLFNFILFFFTRERIYFYYAIYAVLAGIYFSTYFQITEIGFFSAHANMYNFLFFSITLNQALYGWFIFQALKNNKVDRGRKYVRDYAVGISLAAVAIILISIFNFRLAIFLNYIFSIVNGLFTAFIFYKLFNKVSTTVRIILAGSMFVVIGGVGAIIINFFRIAISHVYIYQAGFFIELLFFSVAINFMHYRERIEILKTRLKNSHLESEKLKKEKEAQLLREELNMKNRDLTTKAVIISQKESFIAQVSKSLKKIASREIVDKRDILEVISDLNLNNGKKYWDEFETHFTSVHPNFYKLLNKEYPGLTASERKLCAFLKLNLSTKEIASVSGKSVESVEVARSRLRKKMRLKITDNLNALIASIG